jgi:DNA-binding transcriptional LysR family regulator
MHEEERVMRSSEAAELAAVLAPRLTLLEAIAVERHVTRAAERLAMPQRPSASGSPGSPTRSARPLAHRRRARLQEVATEQFVGMKHGYGLRQITDGLCEDAGFRPELAVEGEEVDTVRGLVGAGRGVAILPPARPSSEEVVELTPAAKRAIGLVWAADAPLAPAARTFRDVAIAARPLARFADRGSVEG